MGRYNLAAFKETRLFFSMSKSQSGIFVVATLCLIVFLYLWTFIFSSDKIGYVDSSKLLNEYKAMVQARAEFEKKQAGWRSNIDTLTSEVKSVMSKYEQLTVSGSAGEKQMAKELIGTKQKQLYDYQNTIRQNAQQEEQKLTQNVLTTVNAFLLKYGKSNGYKLILIAANGNIAYAEPSMDITDKIVEALNKEYATRSK
jgi:outer membrane protein